MVKACIENGAHCIDICGEPQVVSVIRLTLLTKDTIERFGVCEVESVFQRSLVRSPILLLFNQKQQ